MSTSSYDINRHEWRMVWNGDDNHSNDLEGSYRDGAMRFEGWVLDSTGKRQSDDGGKPGSSAATGDSIGGRNDCHRSGVGQPCSPVERKRGDPAARGGES
jgi:hypothetical protein